MKRVNYHGWQNCYQLSNEHVQLMLTTDVGPRILRFGFPEGENVFKEYPETLGKSGGDYWRIYGGHRLWHAPEAPGRSNLADNSHVAIEALSGLVRLVQSTEPKTGIQKEIDIRFVDDVPCVRMTHRLRNRSAWDINLAAWAISVMAPGGIAIIPLPPRTLHEGNYLPASALAVWSYTDLSDRRFGFGREFISIKQDSALRLPQKLGFSLRIGWAAYWHNRVLFVKKFEIFPELTYPDRGSMLEVFTDSEMLELESLGPLRTVKPEEEIEHTEEWWLFRDVPEIRSESDIKREVGARVERILGEQADENPAIALPLTDLIGPSSRRKLPH